MINLPSGSVDVHNLERSEHFLIANRMITISSGEQLQKPQPTVSPIRAQYIVDCLSEKLIVAAVLHSCSAKHLQSANIQIPPDIYGTTLDNGVILKLI